jgi:hypothetical protein
MQPIRNRVEESGLVQFELGSIDRVSCEEFEINHLLRDGLIVVEKEFRVKLKEEDSTRFEGNGVAIVVREDAIIPDWAWMLITAKFCNAAFIVIGNKKDAESEALRLAIEKMDVEFFRDKRVIIKGCGNDGTPNDLIKLQKRLQPVVKTLMFGEACSTVPILKN